MKLRNKKTGDIFDFDFIIHPQHPVKDWFYITTLAELNEDWEDVGDTNDTNTPLIKDEKIRKAFRAWYKLFDESQLGQFKDGKYIAVGFREFILQSLDKSLPYTFELPFIDGMQTLTQQWELDAEYYTIAELCGEEEE